MKRKMEGEAKGARMALSSAMPRGMQRAGARRAVAAMGMASVIQKMTARARTAESRWASGESPGMGKARRRAAASGPNQRPMRRRADSKRASASERRCAASACMEMVRRGAGCGHLATPKR
jgi:hypothetical protein